MDSKAREKNPQRFDQENCEDETEDKQQNEETATRKAIYKDT